MFSRKRSFVSAALIITSCLCVPSANAQVTGTHSAGAAVSVGVTHRSSSARLMAKPSLRLPATSQPMVDDYKITVLSDMIPGRRTIAEWGFAALIEITSAGVFKRFLFDTGGNHRPCWQTPGPSVSASAISRTSSLTTTTMITPRDWIRCGTVAEKRIPTHSKMRISAAKKYSGHASPQQEQMLTSWSI